MVRGAWWSSLKEKKKSQGTKRSVHIKRPSLDDGWRASSAARSPLSNSPPSASPNSLFRNGTFPSSEKLRSPKREKKLRSPDSDRQCGKARYKKDAAGRNIRIQDSQECCDNCPQHCRKARRLTSAACEDERNDSNQKERKESKMERKESSMELNGWNWEGTDDESSCNMDDFSCKNDEKNWLQDFLVFGGEISPGGSLRFSSKMTSSGENLTPPRGYRGAKGSIGKTTSPATAVRKASGEPKGCTSPFSESPSSESLSAGEGYGIPFLPRVEPTMDYKTLSSEALSSYRSAPADYVWDLGNHSTQVAPDFTSRGSLSDDIDEAKPSSPISDANPNSPTYSGGKPTLFTSPMAPREKQSSPTEKEHEKMISACGENSEASTLFPLQVEVQLLVEFTLPMSPKPNGPPSPGSIHEPVPPMIHVKEGVYLATTSCYGNSPKFNMKSDSPTFVSRKSDSPICLNHVGKNRISTRGKPRRSPIVVHNGFRIEQSKWELTKFQKQAQQQKDGRLARVFQREIQREAQGERMPTFQNEVSDESKDRNDLLSRLKHSTLYDDVLVESPIGTSSIVSSPQTSVPALPPMLLPPLPPSSVMSPTFPGANVSSRALPSANGTDGPEKQQPYGRPFTGNPFTAAGHRISTTAHSRHCLSFAVGKQRFPTD